MINDRDMKGIIEYGAEFGLLPDEVGEALTENFCPCDDCIETAKSAVRRLAESRVPEIATTAVTAKEWYAVFPDYYDGAPDSTGLSAAMAWGETEQEAIDELRERFWSIQARQGGGH